MNDHAMTLSPGEGRTQYDVLLDIKGELVWVIEIFGTDLNDAITGAIEVMGVPARYVGHNIFTITNGEWVRLTG